MECFFTAKLRIGPKLLLQFLHNQRSQLEAPYLRDLGCKQKRVVCKLLLGSQCLDMLFRNRNPPTSFLLQKIPDALYLRAPSLSKVRLKFVQSDLQRVSESSLFGEQSLGYLACRFTQFWVCVSHNIANCRNHFQKERLFLPEQSSKVNCGADNFA